MFIDRRTFVKGAAVAGAAAVAPQVLVRTARGQDKNKVLFVSEESNPKAIAVYDKINADFKKETGIEVVMEYPGLRQHRQARGDADRGRHPARDRLVRRRAGHEPGDGEPARGRGRRAQGHRRDGREPPHDLQGRGPLHPDQPAVHLRLVPQGPLPGQEARGAQELGRLPEGRPRRSTTRRTCTAASCPPRRRAPPRCCSRPCS